MATEQYGEIVIAPRVLEKNYCDCDCKSRWCSFSWNKSVSDSLSKRALGRGVYLRTQEDGQISVDIYLYLEYGVAVPKVAVAIQKAVKTAVYNMADVTLDDVNIHVVGIVTEKAAKPDLKDLFNEDFLNDWYFIWITSWSTGACLSSSNEFRVWGDVVEACRFAFTHDKEETDQEVEIPAFLLNLVSGVRQSKDELDQQIAQHLKTGWTVERLTLVEKNILRLGVFEITSFDTPSAGCSEWSNWIS